MAANTFDDYGKVQAIDLLFEDSGFRREDGNGFEPAAGSLVRTASRVFVEGIDFDLTYFPLKHLGGGGGELCRDGSSEASECQAGCLRQTGFQPHQGSLDGRGDRR